MARKPKYTPERVDAVIDMLRQGLTAADVADRFGMKRNAVYKLLRYRNISIHHLRAEAPETGETDHRGGWTPERAERLRVLAAQGLTARQIAAVLGGGLTRNAVIGKAQREDIPLGQNKHSRKSIIGKLYQSGVSCFHANKGCLYQPPVAPMMERQKTCRQLHCGNAPAPFYTHGLCHSCNAERLDRARTRADMREIA